MAIWLTTTACPPVYPIAPGRQAYGLRRIAGESHPARGRAVLQLLDLLDCLEQKRAAPAQKFDTRHKFHIACARRFPRSGIKRERSADELSSNAAAAPATVSGESFVKRPLGHGVPGRRRKVRTREPGDLPSVVSHARARWGGVSWRRRASPAVVRLPGRGRGARQPKRRGDGLRIAFGALCFACHQSRPRTRSFACVFVLFLSTSALLTSLLGRWSRRRANGAAGRANKAAPRCASSHRGVGSPPETSGEKPQIRQAGRVATPQPSPAPAVRRRLTAWRDPMTPLNADAPAAQAGWASPVLQTPAIG